jgi:four helix bundle protein
MDQKGLILDKSFHFAIRVVKLNRYLAKRGEFVLSKQLLRSGTAIGALVREAQYAESSPDFIHKLSIALKEANETCYWLDLLLHTELLEAKLHESIAKDAKEILRMLVAITKTLKQRKSV